jgi:hypothetical protein
MKTVREEITRLKRAKNSVRPGDMDLLLRRLGFERRLGKGDHWVYSHALLINNLTIDPENPLLPVYVSRAIKAMEEVLAIEGVNDDANS